ncbi:PLDc_N domain-containing protein [Leucobacter sp. cx-42]|uniref:PLD nuclease N-terminal domain-containing protein n=1 Tax=unclassified Leucobacter TaxID=2621730 RepID=UPI00165DFFB6|nr:MULTISPECIES: PLD nuclease N-terminal domain-containing protein [unclassified Leucobacter]MBC9954990.1 PLDc_N domain-containing protein [Leucobacter sp. cx-42]
MVRFLIVGVVLAVAFTLFALVDAAMTDAKRARGVAKPVWIILIVLLPVIGAVLWLLVGKGKTAQAQVLAPDDDPRFTGPALSEQEKSVLNDLEAQLRALDNEVFPGEGATDHTDHSHDAQKSTAPSDDAKPASEPKPQSGAGENPKDSADNADPENGSRRS